jgi:hypothetical protein
VAGRKQLLFCGMKCVLMNELEARATLAKYVDRYRARSYEYLATFARLGRRDRISVAVDGGGNYQVDVQVRWESVPDGNVRVISKISERSIHERVITEDFIVHPTGEFAAL